MPSVVDICNRALSRIGASRITSLTDEVEEARACNSAYTQIRDEVLRSAPWNSVSTRGTVAKNSTSPDFEYANSYQLPTDCIRVLDVYISMPWVVEGRSMLTDASDVPMYIRYVKQETDPNQYDPLLASTVAARLAMELAEELTQSNTKRQLAQSEWQELLRMAKNADGHEQSQMTFEEFSWITVRY